uniref:Tudor domain-containing protein n=1 Tax=Spumella elongata TaxID=89044 RepID=A0A7S3GNM7_9STRA
MTHHVWMKNNLTTEQIKAQRKQNASVSKKAKSPPKRNSGTALEMGMIIQELPWNDFTAKGERNPPPVQRAGSALSSNGSGRLQTGSAKSLPPVSHPRSPTAKIFEVGDWVQANFKRAGQLFPGLVKKVHNNGEYYDIDYDDGRAETHVEAKLVRKSTAIGRVSAQFDSVDMLTTADFENSVDSAEYGAHGHTEEDTASPGAHALEQSTDSAYDYSNYNSTYEGNEEGGSQVHYDESYDSGVGYENTGYDSTGYDSANYDSTAYDSAYETDANTAAADPAVERTEDVAAYAAADYPEQPAEEGADAAAAYPDYTAENEVPHEAYAEADYPAEGEALTDAQYTTEKEDYNNHAYDYTNQSVIEEDPNAPQVAQRTTAAETTLESDIPDSAELTEHLNVTSKSSKSSKSTKEVVTDYVGELLDAVVQSSSKPSTAATNNRNGAASDHMPRAESPVQMYDPASHYEYAPKVSSPVTKNQPSEGSETKETEETSQQELFTSPGNKSTDTKSNSPSQIALRSLLQAMELEEASVEGNTTADESLSTSKKGKKKRKSRKAAGESSTSLILQDAESDVEEVKKAPPSRGASKPPTTSQKVTRKFKPLETPEGLFAVPGNQRVKTAGSKNKSDTAAGATGPQPPNVEVYVARAASPPKKRPTTRPKGMSQKSKKVKTKSAKTVLAEAEALEEAAEIAETHEKKVIHGNGLAKLGKPPAAPVRDLHAGVTYEDDDHHSAHSHHSHHSHHTFHSFGSVQGRGPHHHGPDAHGVFDHSDLPHYPFPVHTREEATKIAADIIKKPHNLPADRYTYVMVPAPEHLLHPHGHGHGHGHGHHPHGHGHGHGHGHDHHAHPHGQHGHDNHKAHEGDMSPLDGSNTPVGHDHHGHSDHSGHHSTHTSHSGHSHHSHHSHPVHHSAPFEVRDIRDETLVHHHHDFNVHRSTDPAQFSETFPAPTHSATNSPIPHRRIASNAMSATSSSLPSLPQINRQVSGSRPTSSSVDGALRGHLDPLQEHTVSTVSVADSNNRPMSKSKAARAATPFANKNQYRGPQRRVLDIIEWARVSTGGSPKRQNRKISKVEKRLLKSPLALKLIVDSPLDAASFIDSTSQKR